VCCCRQESSDTSPTSYGEIETIGSTSGSTSGQGQYDYTDDDSDRPLDSLKESTKETAESAQESADSAQHKVGHKFDELKDDIKSATGDIEEDLGQLNVEVAVLTVCILCLVSGLVSIPFLGWHNTQLRRLCISAGADGECCRPKGVW